MLALIKKLEIDYINDELKCYNCRSKKLLFYDDGAWEKRYKCLSCGSHNLIEITDRMSGIHKDYATVFKHEMGVDV